MKIFYLDKTQFEPISHDPQLKKQVLMRDRLSCVNHISHTILQPGNRALEHVHNDIEVFYCIRGASVFLINGQRVPVKKGTLLYVEPGEPHAIPDIIEETEFLYFRLSVKEKN